jgi:ribosomal protein S12 methylthiotransferase RimO
MRKLYFLSLGCAKNLVDSEVMLGELLEEFKLTDDASQADVLIVNSCGFISAAAKESLEAVFELNRIRKKGSVLVLSGCLSQRYKKELPLELREVDIFTGVGDFAQIKNILREGKRINFKDSVFLIDKEKRVITNSNYHAYIKIAEGCNQKCSFCTIPSFKGKLKSRSLGSIAQEVEKFTIEGFYDFSFISQDSSSYLKDIGINDGLIELIDKIEKIEGVKSARILYLYPSSISLNLIEKINSSQIFHNYFEIPIQHTANDVLRSMRRGYREKTIRRILDKIKSFKDFFLRTSVIVGHPNEGWKEFEKLCNFLSEYEFDRVSIFPYYDEEGTLSYTFKNKIQEDIIQERVEILEEIVKKTTERSFKRDVGKIVRGVLEGKSTQSEYLLRCKKLDWAFEIDGEILINNSKIDDLKIGEIYKIAVKEYVDSFLIGEIVEKDPS